ncbi:MAG: glutathione S-transferase family protein [Thermoleophilaceae bacterium]
MKATLFVIPGSHPCVAARLMLESKGIEYKRVDLIPVVSKAVLKAQRFPAVTVPALKLDGRRVQGTRDIAAALDELRPEPPLIPADPDRRAKVDEADRWADTELQEQARRTLWWALKHDRAPMATYAEGARMGVPVSLAVKTGQPVVALSARFNKATDENVQRDLAGLPAAIDRVDSFLADGTIGGSEPNLADYQVASCVRLLMTLDDVLPLIDGRPAAAHARSLVPDYPGRIPAGALPADWLPASG